MSESCSHDCSHCHASCSDKKKTLESMKVAPCQGSNIKHVIGVISGKGGVGKSLVTSMLAVAMHRRGYKTAVLDADITGPSIPQAFGLTGKATSDDTCLYPVESKTGIKIMSLNLLLENTTDAVIWRGPVIAGTARQFWTEVNWGDVDYMFVDMPPGTGDVPLTVFQSLPLDGVIIVSSPQQLVAMIVEKAAKMANAMYVPILALVENMSYFTCPDCGKEHHIFGDSHLEQIALAYNVPHIAQIPIDPLVAQAVDNGQIEDIQMPFLDNIADYLESAAK